MRGCIVLVVSVTVVAALPTPQDMPKTADMYCDLVLKSTKYDPKCMSEPTQVWPLLITASGRSGTLYTAALLNRLGIRVSHDNIMDPLLGQERPSAGPLKHGAVSWVYTFNDASYPKWAGQLNGGRFRKVLHQVRHPLRVIQSRAALPWGEKTRSFITRHIDLPKNDGTFFSDVRDALFEWVGHNVFLRRVADYTYRLEDMNALEICRWADIGTCPSQAVIEDAVRAMTSGEDGVNHVVTALPISWELLFALDHSTATKAKHLACEFGYDCDVPLPRKMTPQDSEEVLRKTYGYVLAVCVQFREALPDEIMEFMGFYRSMGVSKVYAVLADDLPDVSKAALLRAQKDSFLRILNKSTESSTASAPESGTLSAHRLMQICVKSNPDRAQYILAVAENTLVYPTSRSVSTLAEVVESRACDVPAAPLVAVPPKLFTHARRLIVAESPSVAENYVWRVSDHELQTVLAEPEFHNLLPPGKSPVKLLRVDTPRPVGCQDDVSRCAFVNSEDLPACGLRANMYAHRSFFDELTRKVQKVSKRSASFIGRVKKDIHALSLKAGQQGLDAKAMPSAEDYRSQLAAAQSKAEDLARPLAKAAGLDDGRLLQAIRQVAARAEYFSSLAMGRDEGIIPFVASLGVHRGDASKQTAAKAAKLAGGSYHALNTAPAVAAEMIPGFGPPRMAAIVDTSQPCPVVPQPTPVATSKTSSSTTFRFLHIPKTGGTSLNVLLKEAAEMENKRFCEVKTKKLLQEHQKELYKLCDVVSGEFDASYRFHLDERQTGPVKDFIWLRDPVRRTISQFAHHVFHDRIETDDWVTSLRSMIDETTCRQDPYQLCAKLSDGQKCLTSGPCAIFRNHQTEVAAGSWLYSPQVRESIRATDDALLCTAKRMINDISIIGSTELLTASACLLFHEMQWRSVFAKCCASGVINGGFTCSELQSVTFANVRDVREESKISQTASSEYSKQFFARPDVIAEIQDANKLDCQLYKFGNERLLDDLKRLEALTGAALVDWDNLPSVNC